MKEKNGFTLIELLAIIVILAIIAVITVPIILNIIENSRKGAATDSAYGFKDSINKYYVSELSNDKKLMLNGTYEVKANGVLNGNFGVTENAEDRTIPIDGTKPSGGSLTYENNVLKSGYLVIGEYRVTFKEDGTVETVKNNGSSSGTQVDPYSMAAMCPGCKFSNDPYDPAGDDSYDVLGNISLSDNYDNLGSTFFGYVLNNNSIVENYACGIHSGDVYCLGGSVDLSINYDNLSYERNSDILTHFFGDDCEPSIYNDFQCEIGSDVEYLYITNYHEINNGTLVDIQTYDDCSVYVSCDSYTGFCHTSDNCS